MSSFDDYFAAASDPEWAELGRIRRLVRRTVPEAEEATSYGLPAFKYKQRPLLGFRISRNHLSPIPQDALELMLGHRLREIEGGQPG